MGAPRQRDHDIGDSGVSDRRPRRFKRTDDIGEAPSLLWVVIQEPHHLESPVAVLSNPSLNLHPDQAATCNQGVA